MIEFRISNEEFRMNARPIRHSKFEIRNSKFVLLGLLLLSCAAHSDTRERLEFWGLGREGEVVAQMIPTASLAGIHIFFPDPWPKKRHHKRRLLQPPFVRELALRLAAGGFLHAATDWKDYAAQILAAFAAEPLLENSADGYAPRPAYRPLTKFERRGIGLGHGVFGHTGSSESGSAPRHLGRLPPYRSLPRAPGRRWVEFGYPDRTATHPATGGAALS